MPISNQEFIDELKSQVVSGLAYKRHHRLIAEP